MKIQLRRKLILLIFSGLMVGAIWAGWRTAQAEPVAATPIMMATSNLFAPPPTVYPPSQANNGQELYYYHCMTCHGDVGQGLTEEWRSRIGAPETNCWASQCHSPNHIDGSFTFPHVVPALIGPGVLSNFKSGLELHNFIQARMPYQAPGSLTDVQYWDLTAFLLRQNGFPIPPNLDAASAVKIALQPTPTPTPFTTWLGNAGWPYAIFGAALLIAAVVFLMARIRMARMG